MFVLGMGLSASPAIATTKKVSILFSGRVPALCNHKESKNQRERASSRGSSTLRTQKPIGLTSQKLTTCLVY
ncbi:hypothetical protein SynSYN20_03295 [Synechococcus sp. SYN20]|nr:hypothetical protein SynSYN20_03295 [Synechococcus sp. SYN20]